MQRVAQLEEAGAVWADGERHHEPSRTTPDHRCHLPDLCALGSSDRSELGQTLNGASRDMT